MRRALALALLAACGEPPPPAPRELPALARASSPRLDEVAVLATHNSYWVDRHARGDLFASGVSQRLTDQLAFNHVRSLELDIHRDLRVYHTVPGNSLCVTLRDCLAEVRAFTWAVPDHHPLILILELKELFAPNFTAEHRPEDLDETLRDELRAALYTPADLLARCPGDTTLSACVARAGWPSVAELRGRILVTLLGNWDEMGGQATVDWVHYTTGPISTRAAFPMASSWKLRLADLPPRLREQLTQRDLDRAFAQSPFLQVEQMDDPDLTPFLAAGGIVRANGAEGVAAQEQRIALGVQLLQTDTPWLRADAVGPTVEPGRRLYLSAEPGEEIFAHHGSPAPLHDLSIHALVATGQPSARTAATAGCLRIASADGRDRLTLCREHPPYRPGPAAERTRITLETCSAGACQQTDRDDQHGDLLGLTGDAAGCVQARAGHPAAPATRAPTLPELGPAWCPAPTDRPWRRGIVVRSAAMPGTVGFLGPDIPPLTTVEVTRDGGPPTEIPARLIDASAP